MAIGLCVALSVVVGFGLAGLVLAVLGAFLPILVVPAGAVASAALVRGAQGVERLPRPGLDRIGHGDRAELGGGQVLQRSKKLAGRGPDGGDDDGFTH